MFDLHDLAALRLLFLIAHKSTTSSDPTSAIDNSNILATGTNANGTLFFTSNHDNGPKIMDLWGSYWTHFRGCSVDRSGYIQFYSPMNAVKLLVVKTGTEGKYRFPSFATFPQYIFGMTIYSGPITIGDDVHDSMEFFMPDSFTSVSSRSVWNALVLLDLNASEYTWSFGGWHDGNTQFQQHVNSTSLFSMSDEIPDDAEYAKKHIFIVARLAKS